MLKLKEVIEKEGIGLRELARLCKLPVTNMSNIINKGEFTRKDEKAGVRKRIVAVLKERGVREADLFNLFAPDRKYSRPRNAGASAPWEGEMLSQETLDFFAMAEDPFEHLKSATDIFRASNYKRVKSIVLRAIQRRNFLAVWGDVGAGKTILWKEIEQGLGEKYRVIKPAILEKERLSIYNLQEAVIIDLKASREDYTTGMRASREARDRQIRELLRLYDEEGIGAVLVIEEAHTLPLRTLKALKRLHEIQYGFSAPLAIVLLGQPELKHELWDDLRIREVTRRCRLVELPRLRSSEITGYVTHKFTRAGEKPHMITAEAWKAVAEIFKSGESPLKMNNFMSYVLNQACELGKKKINADMIYSLIAS